MKKIKISPLNVIVFAFLSVYVLSMIILIGWGFMTSFKSQSDFRLNIMGLPEKWEWNYSLVFDKFKYPVTDARGTKYVDVFGMLANTILYAGGCAVTQTMTPCIVAYCCARYRYKLSNVIPYIVITVMTLSIAGSLPSEIQMARMFGLYDQIWGLWIMKCNFLGTYFLVFLGMFSGIPKALDEAARIDGANDLTIMVRIVMPTVVPTILTIMLLNFIGFWNDYTVPLVYLPHYPTISQGLQYMSKTNDNDMASVPMRMTASMIILMPTLFVFVAFQKKLVGNITFGAVKG
ncbi:MAG: carbohydrate ABC transporter permease [Clostridia bacterium]|nr:carbohydrate ABC transporter permease [Clostridia bacterium]